MSQSIQSHNPLLSLPYIPAFEALGDDYFDPVAAADFPQHSLRFRNDLLLPQLGLTPETVRDDHFIEAFGLFQGRSPFLAMRYHGYQFGEYNPYLGDGRGFLHGQVRGVDGNLYDFGTKGSGRTPYSRGGDGRLTLKGGVREVIAAEALHTYGVNTSRCLSMIETGEQLWRGDEPSPTRSSVMIRLSQSHIRFGTFERLHYLQRPDLVKKLLDHVIEYYYPHLITPDRPHHESNRNPNRDSNRDSNTQRDHEPDPGPKSSLQQGDRYGQFFAELVHRVATLVAQWMAAGFCHAVLNTDNMSITGESFDYGPYAFIETFDPRFTAAYFDHGGRYSYGNQPHICLWNLELLQYPLKMVMPLDHIEAGLAQYQNHYDAAYRRLMMQRLGFEHLPPHLVDDLLAITLKLLHHTSIGYHDFFLALRQQFRPDWRVDSSIILPNLTTDTDAPTELVGQWRSLYHHALNQYGVEQMEAIAQRLSHHNPDLVPIRPEIEAIWEPIVLQDNWQPFYTFIKRIQTSVLKPDLT